MPQATARPSTPPSRLPGPSRLPVTSRAQLRRTLHRRRVLLAVLLLTALVSLVLALVARQVSTWGVHATADALLLGYVAVLLHSRNAAAEYDMARRQLGRN